MLDKSVKVIVKKFGKPGDIEPGDVFATNDPYYGGVTHLNDIIVAMPVFAGGRIIAWTANIAHNSDVGGMAPGSLTGDGDRDLPGRAQAAGNQADLARARRSAR